jgi:hypothetical protein
LAPARIVEGGRRFSRAGIVLAVVGGAALGAGMLALMQSRRLPPPPEALTFTVLAPAGAEFAPNPGADQ